MALRASTGCRNLQLGTGRATVHALIVANTISFTASTKTIADSGNGLGTIKVADKLYVEGTSNNDGSYTVVSVTAGAVVVSESLTDESAGTYFALAAGEGGSVKDIFRDGVIEIRSGTQPSSPDDAVAGTLLVTITKDGGSFTPGQQTNGLNLGVAASAQISKNSDTWKGTAVASGTAGWFRWKGNATDAGGASTTLPRLDGSVAQSGGDLTMVSTAIVSAQEYNINTADLTLPLQNGA